MLCYLCNILVHEALGLETIITCFSAADMINDFMKANIK